MVSLKIAIRKAIDQDNHVAAGRIADGLRFRHGMDYNSILAVVQKVRPDVTPAQWDELMQRWDRE